MSPQHHRDILSTMWVIILSGDPQGHRGITHDHSQQGTKNKIKCHLPTSLSDVKSSCLLDASFLINLCWNLIPSLLNTHKPPKLKWKINEKKLQLLTPDSFMAFAVGHRELGTRIWSRTGVRRGQAGLLQSRAFCSEDRKELGLTQVLPLSMLLRPKNNSSA